MAVDLSVDPVMARRNFLGSQQPRPGGMLSDLRLSIYC